MTMSMIFLSCKKDEEKSSGPLGLYKGFIGEGDAEPTNEFALLFRNNGTIRYFDNIDTNLTSTRAEGTYTLDGNNFTYELLIPFGQTGSGTFNNDYSIAEGNWSNITLEGKFRFEKQ